ncbi:ATPase 4 plasma membrane-type [Bienertia sinuspersici]
MGAQNSIHADKGAAIDKVYFLPFKPTDKRTALTYIDNEGGMHRVSKGAPEQILNLAHNKSDIERRVHAVIDKFAERGLRSLAVAYQDFQREGKKVLEVHGNFLKRLQARKHICGMTGDGVNDAPALTEPGLSVIISAVLTSRAIF